MNALVGNFVREDRGQDLTEYTLLMAFIMLIIMALVTGMSNSIVGITTTTNAQLTRANAAVASGSPMF